MYLLIVAILALAIIIALTLYKKIKSTPVDKIHGRAAPVRREEGAALRRQQARNQRGRLRLNAAARLQDSDDENDANVNDEENEQQLPDFGDDKMGAKKRAKLEAKAEKKSQREMEQKSREDKKKREALAEEERRKIEEKEKLEEKRKEEEERSAQEEQERREHEEYLKMKEAFSVEEEGYEEAEQDEKENLLQEFIDYIKNNKVVVLEDLAAHFKLKTQAVIDRITELKKDGIITGVIDDRGKFIYISEKELNAVAKFIKQRGRVSITELAENSNTLITLDPKPTVNV